MLYIYSMDKKHISIKIWRCTLSKLRLLAAMKEQSIVSLFDELVTKELEHDKKINDKS